MRKALLVVVGAFAVACGPDERWHVVHEELDQGLVSVWGRSATDIYAVGGDTGSGPLVLRYDGARWTRLSTGSRGDLWWVNGASEGPVYMGGSGGLILRYDGSSFTVMDTPGTGTVFGIWAAAADDVWAVGGVGASAGFVWRSDGERWTALDVPELAGRGLFKVWGTGPDDVWIVGAAGAAYHWNGNALEPVDAGTSRTLFTVHLEGDRAAAVGGAGTAALVEREGGMFVDRSPELVPQLFGVWLTPNEGGYAVGAGGVVLRRTAQGWSEETTELPYIPALHAVWVDESGGVWAVGGQVLAAPLTDGVLIYRGATVPAGMIEEGT
jgi:hypothetical protein